MTDQTLPLSAAQEQRIRRDTRADVWFRRLLFSAALLVLLVLVGAVKMADRVVREMMGL